jgi:hypothetical protein
MESRGDWREVALTVAKRLASVIIATDMLKAKRRGNIIHPRRHVADADPYSFDGL